MNKPTLATLATAVGIVVGALAIYSQVKAYTPSAIMHSIEVERLERQAADDSARVERTELRKQVRQMVNAMSLFATAMAEPNGSQERQEAIRALRRMRRFEVDNE